MRTKSCLILCATLVMSLQLALLAHVLMKAFHRLEDLQSMRFEQHDTEAQFAAHDSITNRDLIYENTN
jgi:hypothetical protein